jgi:hypothetical protein
MAASTPPSLSLASSMGIGLHVGSLLHRRRLQRRGSEGDVQLHMASSTPPSSSLATSMSVGLHAGSLCWLHSDRSILPDDHDHKDPARRTHAIRVKPTIGIRAAFYVVGVAL